MPDPVPPRRPAFGHAKSPPPPPPPAFEVCTDQHDVIDLAAPLPKAARPAPPPKPAFEVCTDQHEVVDLAPPRPARGPVKAAVKAVAARASDEDEDDRPRPAKKKKKKKRASETYDADADAQAHRDAALARYQWVIPGMVLAVGLVLCFVGGILAGGAVGVAYTLLVLVVGLVIAIPIAVAALMTIGMMAGIDYGALGPGVFKIAAITSVANGIMFLGDGLDLPPFLYLPVSGLATLILFMTQFELDYGEANTSVGAINLMSFGVKTLLFLFLVAGTPKSDKTGDEYPSDGDDEDAPAAVDRDARPARGKGTPPEPARPFDPEGDDFDDD